MGDYKIAASIMNDCKLGNSQVDKIYLGNELLWSKIVYGTKIMTFSPQGDTTGVVTLTVNVPYAQNVNIQNGYLYDTNAGTTGQSVTKWLTTGSNNIYIKCSTTAYLYFDAVDKITGLNSLNINAPICETINFINDLNYLQLQNNCRLIGALNLSNTITHIYLGNYTDIGSIPYLPNSLITLSLLGSNESVSSLPTLPINLKFLDIRGRNTISSLPTLPDTLETLSIVGYSSLSSLPALPTGLRNLSLMSSNNTFDFNLANLQNSIVNFSISSNGNITYNSTPGKSWGNSYIATIYVYPKINIWTSNMTDSLLIDLVSSNLQNGTINLLGNCGARTSASNTAVNTLLARGVTINTH